MIGQSFSQYNIIEKLGEGGMGHVYLAEDTELRRKVALKFLPKHYTSDPDIRARFKREAQAAAALNHPNIITIYEISEYEDGSYIAMEFVEGQSLREMIEEGEIPIDRSLDLMLDICDGIAVAHENDIIHRDIKPANIMFDRYGRVKILDFGLAKQGGITRITRSGTTLGTPSYMSPEQVKGMVLDIRSDIYALGVLFYEMLTAHVPFEGNNEAAILYSIVHEKPVPVTRRNPEVPKRWQKIVDKCLDKNVNSRYQTVADLREDLRQEKKLREQQAQLTKTSIRVKPVREKKKPLIWLASAAGVALLAVLLFMFLKGPLGSNRAETDVAEQPTVRQSKPTEESASDPTQPEEEQARGPDTPVQQPETTQRLASTQPPSRSQDAEDSPSATSSRERESPDRPQPQVDVGEVVINSVPEGAFVWLDGERIGQTPYRNRTMKAGNYRLRLTMNGFEDLNRSINVRAGRENAFRERMISAMGRISVSSEPTGAQVLIDGEQIGTSPVRNHSLEPGSHKVEVRKSGYQQFSRSIDIRAGKAESIAAPLVALTGKLRFLARPYATISVDGKEHKSNWDRWFELELSAGPHTVRAENPRHGVWQKQIDIKAEDTVPVQIDFTKTYRVTIAATPAWGHIYIDGENIAKQTPSVVELSTGQHSIEVRREGYETEGGARVVTVDQDFKDRLLFNLKKK